MQTLVYSFLLSLAVILYCGCHDMPIVVDSDVGDNGYVSDSLYLSKPNSIVLSPQNQFAMSYKLSPVNGGEYYEASFFRYQHDPFVRICGNGSWGDYYYSNWQIDSFKEWEKVPIRIRIPDTVLNGSVNFFIQYTGSRRVFVDSVTIKRLRVSDEDLLPDFIMFPLLDKIQSHYYLVQMDTLPLKQLDVIYKELPMLLFERLGVNSKTAFIKTFHSLIRKIGFKGFIKKLINYNESISYVSVTQNYNNRMELKALAGYTDKLIYNESELIKFYIEKDSNINDFSVEVFKLQDKYRKETILKMKRAEDSTFSILAKKIGVGFFEILLSADSIRHSIPLIISRNDKPDIIVLAPVTTWHAYNDYGGKSFYRNVIDNLDVNYVSTNRPIVSVDFDSVYLGHDLFITRNIFDWFNNNYSSSIYPDYFLEAYPELFDSCKTIVIAQHCEYFSPQMYQQLLNLKLTKNLLFLGGNQIYWKIMWHDNFTKLEVHKDGNYFDNTLIPGGLWRDEITSEASLIGTAYTDAGNGTYSSYLVKDSNHWLFDNIQLPKDMIFGRMGIDGRGLSGDETDKVIQGAPPYTQTIAKGLNIYNSGGEFVLLNYGNNATLSCGSIACGSGLSQDSIFTKVIKNFMTRFHENYPDSFAHK